MINYIFWDISPIALKLGPLEIRWYGILLATGFFFAYLTFLNIFKKEGMSQEFTDKFAIRLVLWTVVGLRLGHVLFYEPAYYFKHPLEIFMIWKGGLASHGAAIAIIIVIYFYPCLLARQNKPRYPAFCSFYKGRALRADNLFCSGNPEKFSFRYKKFHPKNVLLCPG